MMTASPKKSALNELLGELDTRRKAYLVLGKALDFVAECKMEPDEDFDIDHSIFSVLEKDSPARARIQQQMAWKPVWSEEAMARYALQYSAIPRPPPENA